MKKLGNSENNLQHIGIIRRSGRFPWGSGNDPYQNSVGFKKYMDEMTEAGMTPTQIAEALTEYANRGVTDPKQRIKISTTDLRANTAISTEQIYAENQHRAEYLTRPPAEGGRGMSTSAAARLMGVNESTMRGWLKTSQEAKEGSLRATANALKEHAEGKPFLDVGKGTHLYMGVTFTKLNTALAMLHDEGYEIHSIKGPQLGTDKLTTYKVLTKGGVTWKEAYDAVQRGDLKTVAVQSDDGGVTFKIPKADPVSVPSKRIQVRYDEDGGTKMDGVIELRRGVDDISLGSAKYAQVRIAVDGTHYLKGMAMYADDLPDGVDIRFNTNKSKHDPKAGEAAGKTGAMKEMKTVDGKIDTSNPFGATTRPKMYVDKNGKEQTSPLNIVNEEGRWDEWSKSLSSQMLSKQPLSLAARQLGEARSKRQKELDEIMKLTNPVVKKKLLEDFAETADAAAVHLKAAALPRQATRVILPMNSMRPNEIYAPDFNDGEKVALVRHPHGGPFEIPSLTVNNKNAKAKRIMGGALDAVGIHHSVAEQLSGADFDGDTVLVIPNNDGRVKSRQPLTQLEGFNAKESFRETPGMTYMTKKNTQTEMGKISNLITDMTIHKASDDELARAVKHSMVVIDAEKHKLDYKKSEAEHGIAALKKKYQGSSTGGASTLISRASSETRVPKRRLRPMAKGGHIDPKTGRLIYENTGEDYPKTVTKVNKRTGEVTTVTTRELRKVGVPKMELTDDANTLLSEGGGTPMEKVYAAHANSLKGMANDARKTMLSIKDPRQSPSAKAVYAEQYKSLTEKLQLAQRNAPLERRAQALGNAMAKARIENRPDADKDDIKKIKYQSLDEARKITGADKKKLGSDDLPITPREWEAIQAGALSSTMLREILSNSDMTRIKELATPRPRTSLTTGQLAIAKQLQSTGRYSMADIAERLGIPRSTLVDNLKT